MKNIGIIRHGFIGELGANFGMFALSLAASVAVQSFAAGHSAVAAQTSAEIATSKGNVRITSPSAGALRVTRGEPVSPELVFVSAGSLPVEVAEAGDETKVRSGDLTAIVSRNTGLVRFEGPKGEVLAERGVGAKSAAFDSPKGERLYGLGQFQDGVLNVRNLPRRLIQVNTQISSPFLVSTRGWGLYWHTYAKVDFNRCDETVALSKEGEGGARTVDVSTGAGGAKERRRDAVYVGEFDAEKSGEYAFFFDCGGKMARQQVVEIDGRRVVENRNFWLPPTVGFRLNLSAGRHKARILAESRDNPSLAFRRDRCETTFTTDSKRDGTDYVVYLGAPDSVVSRFRADTGGTAALPDWAWGYWHCQERFRSQKELLAAMHWFRDRDLPLSVIVQDWQWWRRGTWNSMEWDRTAYPDPKAMADECHENGVRVMLSVWSKTGGNSDFANELKAADAFVPGTQWIDFSNPKACDIYWKWFEKCCVSTGIDAWWLDAVEPENDDLHGRTFALGDGDEFRNVYPLLVNTEADRRMRALRPGETPLVLTRCAFAGQQRTASVMWSGDVGSSWDALRKQVVAGLGFAMSGFPYWTSDAGGFFRPNDQYANKAYHKVLARWVEFATFCPIQRVHGYKSDTTPSRFGPETEKILCDQIRLRERLRPYILETAREVASENAMFMRPLWEAPAGFETEYMFGRKMLVCPVVADVEEMDVWIPEGEWRDFHTGEAVKGGGVRRVRTPIDRIPVFVKSEKGAAPFAWPEATQTMRPWVYNWWMGNAVDEEGIRHQCEEMKDKGFGGFHVIPIYGAKNGYEKKWKTFLSPEWVEAWNMAVATAKENGLGVDLTMGSGWCFGGPWIDAAHASTRKFKVKRACVGGAGYMIDPFDPEAMKIHVAAFDGLFGRNGKAARPRAFYHDSYEYYGAKPKKAGNIDEMQLSCFRVWTDWCRENGYITRNEAHGAPSNWLDFYALADIPETEMFGMGERDILVSKFASSAAHAKGTTLVAAESCTWIDEHFCERPAAIKEFLDSLFLSGVNHVFYHGLCYSPVEAAWPGWCFYATLEMNPRNPIWREMSAFNAYVTRCQSVFQTWKPDNDLALVWDPAPYRASCKDGMGSMTVTDAKKWLYPYKVGRLAKMLFGAGYSFDYLSRRMVWDGLGKRYAAVVDPEVGDAFDEAMKSGGESIRGVRRMPFDAASGLVATRWTKDGATAYFVVNTGDVARVVSSKAGAYTEADPLSGAIAKKDKSVLAPKQSLFLVGDGFEIASAGETGGGARVEVAGPWTLLPVCGGPELPKQRTIDALVGWETLDEFFSGTMVYSTTFSYRLADLGRPTSNVGAVISLGEVREIARVRLNGRDLGVRFMAPYEFRVPEGVLKEKGNILEVEVTNLGANRLRWNDINKVNWKYFCDINVVGRNYKPFDASKWAPLKSGLIGPVEVK